MLAPTIPPMCGWRGTGHRPHVCDHVYARLIAIIARRQNLPRDTEDARAAIADWIVANSDWLQLAGKETLVALAHILVGMVLGGSLNQELVLRRDDFKARIAQMTARQTRPGAIGRPRTNKVEEPMGDYYFF